MRLPRLSPGRLAIVFLVVLAVGVAALYVRNTQHVLKRQQREIHADCRFAQDVARAPEQVATPGQGLLLLAHDARVAYVGKGCEDELGPAPTAYPTVSATP